nr:hypothetical protein [Anaerolineae bacterium]
MDTQTPQQTALMKIQDSQVIKLVRRTRSWFWPVMVLGVGLFWLLHAVGIIKEMNISLLFQTWQIPVGAVVLNLLLTQHWPKLGTYIAVVAVVAGVVVLTFGPRRGWVDPDRPLPFAVTFDDPVASSAGVRVGYYTETLVGVETAQMQIDLSRWDAQITPLLDDVFLFNSEIYYIGEIEFVLDKGADTGILLRERSPLQASFAVTTGGDAYDYEWQIGISPLVPVDLNVSVASGDAVLDLEGLQITALSVESRAGQVLLVVPAMEDRYTAQIETGADYVEVIIPEGAKIDADLEGGSAPMVVKIGPGSEIDITLVARLGDVFIDVPDDAGVRVEIVGRGRGHIGLTPGYEAQEVGRDDPCRMVWIRDAQSPGAGQVTIRIEDFSTGDINIY